MSARLRLCRVVSLAALTGIILFLQGCKSQTTDVDRMTGIPGLSEKLAASNAAQEKVTIAEARKHYAGFTVKSYDTSHGTQVEYMSPDGRCYLWYPGNTRVLPCKWKIAKKPKKVWPGQNDKTINVTHVCYSYPENSRNPVTGHRGSAWQCSQAVVPTIHADGTVTMGIPAGFAPSTVDKVNGDPFGLARRSAVPFVMEKKTYSFSELKAGLT